MNFSKRNHWQTFTTAQMAKMKIVWNLQEIYRSSECLNLILLKNFQHFYSLSLKSKVGHYEKKSKNRVNSGHFQVDIQKSVNF